MEGRLWVGSLYEGWDATSSSNEPRLFTCIARRLDPGEQFHSKALATLLGDTRSLDSGCCRRAAARSADAMAMILMIYSMVPCV